MVQIEKYINEPKQKKNKKNNNEMAEPSKKKQRMYYSNDTEGVGSTSNSFPIAIAIIKVDPDLQIKGIFYETTDPALCFPDKDTIGWWHSKDHLTKMYEEMPQTCSAPKDMAEKLVKWVEAIADPDKEKSMVVGDNPGYDSAAIGKVLATVDRKPLRWVVAGDVYGSETTIDDVLKGVQMAKPELTPVFEGLFPVAQALVKQLLPQVLTLIPEGLRGYTTKFWEAHHPVYDALELVVHSILCFKAAGLSL